MTELEPEERRLRAYFLQRAIELLEAARQEPDVIRRLDLEQRAAAYWQIARTK